MSAGFRRAARLAVLCWAIASLASAVARDSAPVVDDVALAEQRALAAAVDHVAEAVVQIRTIGGLEQVDDTVLAQGPTTGVVVRSDGYIVSSSFNFAQRPSSILVRLPDGSQAPAEIVGRDENLMLVLLKVEADDPLPVPTPQPLEEIRVGQRVAAVGRTFVAERVNTSVGVVSALGRMHGRVLQTDAKVSAANYGGPLVDLSGRVLGVLTPMAPGMTGAAGESSEVAGAEYYDSGIAFAAPWEHVSAVLPRWIEAGDLQRGVLGVGLKDGPAHATPPEVTSIWPRSPAAEAGWKQGDVIIAVDDQPVVSQTQLRTAVVPKYAGDRLRVTLRRGAGDQAKELNTEITLAAELPPFQQAFLGVLPERPAVADAETEDPPAGVVVRAVWPESPAAAAGVKVGDRVTAVGETEISTTASAVTALTSQYAGVDIELTVVRDDEPLTLQLTTEDLPTEVLASDQLGRQPQGDEADANAANREFAEVKLPQFSQAARVLAPAKTTTKPGLLLWLGTTDVDANREFAESWQTLMDRDQFVLAVAEPRDESGWTGDDLEFLSRMLPVLASQYGVDPRRAVIGGEGKAGQLAAALALQSRGQLAGAATLAAPLPRTLTLRDNAPGAPLALLMIATQNSPFSMLIDRDARRLQQAGYPVSQASRRGSAARDGRLDNTVQELIARWLDGLDRI